MPTATLTGVRTCPQGLRADRPLLSPVWENGSMHDGLRVLTLNVAHGRGVGFHQSLTRRRDVEKNLDDVARLIAAVEADVVALQELDAPSAWSGGFDHLAWLADRTGFNHVYHGLHMNLRRPVPLAYGTGVLSRFPIREGFTRRFAQNPLDTKGFVHVRVAGPGFEMDVVSVHLDFKRERERRAQLSILGRHLQERGKRGPLVVAGDFNTTRCRQTLPAFMGAHQLRPAGDPDPTFPAARPRRRLDEVLVCECLEVRRHQVPDVQVSDHRPVLAEVGLDH